MTRIFQSLFIALSFVLLSHSISLATSPNSNIECRIYDPNKRCVWVLKSNPYPIPYVAPNKTTGKAFSKRYRARTLPNPILSPLPIVAEQKAINQQSLILESTTIKNDINTPKIVMDTTTGIKPVEQKAIHIDGILAPTNPNKVVETKPLSGRVEINDIIPVKPSRNENKSIAVVAKATEHKRVEPDKLKEHYSWVNISSGSIHEQIADELVQFISMQKPDMRTVLRIEPAIQIDNKFTPILLKKLQNKGYSLASEQAQLVSSTNVRYVVDETSGGILVRVQFENSEGARWFVLDQSKANLLAVSPFTLKRGN